MNKITDCCVVMQPMFLPWSGYFNLAAQADVFVFLDDVPYEKQGWQNRNRILVGGQVKWMVVPVRHRLGQLIKDLEIDNNRPWQKKLLATLRQNYAKRTAGNDVIDLIEAAFEAQRESLATLNERLIRDFAEKLHLMPRFERAGTLGVEGGRSQRLLNFCLYSGCGQYHSPVGSAGYLAEDGCFEAAEVKLTFQNFTPARYYQPKIEGFESHLSIVDVVANIGWDDAAEYIRSRKTPHLKQAG